MILISPLFLKGLAAKVSITVKRKSTVTFFVMLIEVTGCFMYVYTEPHSNLIQMV